MSHPVLRAHAKRLDSVPPPRYVIGAWRHPLGVRATGTAPAMQLPLSSLFSPLFDVLS
jgi:hypothetical protein